MESNVIDFMAKRHERFVENRQLIQEAIEEANDGGREVTLVIHRLWRTALLLGAERIIGVVSRFSGIDSDKNEGTVYIQTDTGTRSVPFAAIIGVE